MDAKINHNNYYYSVQLILQIETHIVSPSVDFPFIEFFLATIVCMFNPTPSSDYINVITTGTRTESIWPNNRVC